MIDQYGRTIDYLRISITDRCNLRCVYCMPQDGVVKQCPDAILSYEEIGKLTEAFASLGIKKLKITGGEPLVRKDVADLIAHLYTIEGIEDITLTTNGVLLDEQVEALYQAGIRSINISLDSLKEDKFHQITRSTGADKVLRGLRHALQVGMKVKVNVLAVKGMNDDELVELAGLARTYPLHVRFIELMPIGFGRAMTGISETQIRAILTQAYGPLQLVDTPQGNGPCVYYRCDGFQGYLGFISALSHKFCDSCNRIRLTSSGFLKPCLQYDTGIDLRSYLEKDPDTLVKAIEETIYHKPHAHAFGERHQHSEHRLMSDIGG